MMLPVVKLGTLVARTISKPIASRLKKAAGRHPKFRHFIVNIAQFNHRVSTNIQRRISSRKIKIRPLNEGRAVQAAGDLIGEFFLFSVVISLQLVATAAITFEVQRNARSEARKEEVRQRQIQVLTEREEELAREVEVLKQKYSEIEQLARGRAFTCIPFLTLRRRNNNASTDSKEVKPA